MHLPRSAVPLFATLIGLSPLGAHLAAAQADERFVPVTDEMLQNPSPDDWLMWRRTLDGWGYSPLDQIDRGNVGDLRLVWSRALRPGAQEGTPSPTAARSICRTPTSRCRPSRRSPAI